jgi:hypothetical protein
MSAFNAWVTDAFNLLLQRLDRACDALERIADALEDERKV